jgi:hypothetical protein
MAKPRVFISSTFFDLRSLRDDLDRFVKSQGFDPVRHERGHIPYGSEDRPEQYAYREIDTCDMLVCVIGGRYGTVSASGNYSITQRELKTAQEKGKQVYIFVEDSVLNEYRYFQANRSVPGVKFPAVESVKVHEFLEEIHGLAKGNPIFSFSVGGDITSILQEQWAGLFQRLLQESASRQQSNLVEELQRSLSTVGQLVEFLSVQNNSSRTAIDEILFENHPLFSELKDVLGNPYRIYFRTLEELSLWLKAAKLLEPLDDPLSDAPDHYEWIRVTKLKDKERQTTLQIAKSLFGQDGRLRPMQYSKWDSSSVRVSTKEFKRKSKSFDDLDDDIPF